MAWRVLIGAGARKAARRLPQAHRDSLLLFVEALTEEGPVPDKWDVRKLVGREAEYRLRLGGWRVIYRVDRDDTTITIMDIATRGDVY